MEGWFTAAVSRPLKLVTSVGKPPFPTCSFQVSPRYLHKHSRFVVSQHLMKQVLQNRKTGRPFVGEVPVPALQRGRVLVRTVASLISAGTERLAVEMVSKGLVNEARQRPDLVKAVVAKVKSEGLLNTFASVRDKMEASTTLGYSAAGVVTAVAEDV